MTQGRGQIGTRDGLHGLQQGVTGTGSRLTGPCANGGGNGGGAHRAQLYTQPKDYTTDGGWGLGRLGFVPSREEVIDALRAVEDPELGMDIVDLGLLYDVAVEGPKVHVTFSLTSMGCPVGPMIEEQIRDTVSGMPGVEEVESELTWDPPWSPEKMSDDAKFILGFG